MNRNSNILFGGLIVIGLMIGVSISVVTADEPTVFEEAPKKSIAMIEALLAEGAVSNVTREEVDCEIYDVIGSSRNPVYVPDELDTEVQVGPSVLTPMGLFDSDTYPKTCYPTEENFREQYARELRSAWNMSIDDFLALIEETEFDSPDWEFQVTYLKDWRQEYDGYAKVGYLLSPSNDVDFEATLTKVWESRNVQSLYQRHMGVFETSSWTAAVQYQGDIDYVAQFNDDIFNHIASLIWDSDPNLAFLFAVQQHAENTYE